MTPNFFFRSSAEVRPNSHMLPSQAEPNIRPNASAEVRRSPNFGPSLVACYRRNAFPRLSLSARQYFLPCLLSDLKVAPKYRQAYKQVPKIQTDHFQRIRDFCDNIALYKSTFTIYHTNTPLFTDFDCRNNQNLKISRSRPCLSLDQSA